ncbi:MAG TPA: hypothetical protein PK195_08025, partial [Ignavibacteriaceae bacterium]|nr:hypothetical protein [Ignavibacteriaceae bacterium]
FINIICLFSMVLIPVSINFVLPVAVKLIFDIYVAVKRQNELGHRFNLLQIIPLQIVFEIFLIINFINSLSGKVEWK